MSSPHSHSLASPGDFSSIPVVVGWLVAVTTILCVIVKIVTKMTMSRSFVADDYAMVTSLGFSVAMVAVVAIAGSNGLGKRDESISATQFEKAQKASQTSSLVLHGLSFGVLTTPQSLYAMDMLYILTLGTSKLAVLVLVRNLTLLSLHHIMIYATAGLISLWTLASVFVAAFQCPLPHTWAILKAQCIDQQAFWASYSALNMLTELCLIILPALSISKVQISRKRKTTISALFAMRVFMFGPIIAELYFRTTTPKSTDRFYHYWRVVVCALLTQCVSIVTACIPYLKPFFVSLESGMVRVDDTRRRGNTTRPGYYYKNNPEPNSNNSSSSKKSKSKGLDTEMDTLATSLSVGSGTMGTSNQIWSNQNGSIRDDERSSVHSTSRIIRATTTYGVQEEDIRADISSR